MNTFARMEQLLGTEECAKLKAARIAVVGLGGVGSFAVEALARAGIGSLWLADFDCVNATNINRQLFALHSTIRRPKAEVARERVQDINPRCRVTVFTEWIHHDTIDALLDAGPEVVIDAIDSLSPKAELIYRACQRGIHVVASMGAAGRTDPLHVRCGDLAETTVCPLARMLRKRLHRRGIYSGIRCVFSTEAPRTAQPFDEGDRDESPASGRRRVPLGSISYLPGIFGLIAAGEAIRYCLARPQ